MAKSEEPKAEKAAEPKAAESDAGPTEPISEEEMAKRAPKDKEAAEPSGKTVSLTWNGPDDQSVVGIGVLKNGESYDVPVEQAEGLMAGSAGWEK